jgi:tetratricopeptide (TPR) repeat protein
MKKKFGNLIFFVLVLLPSLVYSQNAEQWYETGRRGFEGRTGNGGVKAQLQEIEQQLSALLRDTTVLEDVVAKKEQLTLNGFFSECMIQHLSISDDIRQNLFSGQQELSLSRLAIQSFIETYQININTLLPDWRQLSSSAQFFDQLSQVEEATDIPEVEDYNITSSKVKSQEVIDLKDRYVGIGQEIKKALSQLDRATEIKPDYADAYLKKVELYLITHQEEKAVREFEKVRALKFRGVTLPDVLLPLPAPQDEEADKYTFSLTKLVYSIASLHLQGKFIPKAILTGQSLDPADDAARAVISEYIQFIKAQLDQEHGIEGPATGDTEDQVESRKVLTDFELVKFYLFVGRPDLAGAEYGYTRAQTLAVFLDLLNFAKTEINNLRVKIRQATKVFMGFHIEEGFPLTRIRLVPGSGEGEAQNITDYLAITYQEIGTKVKLAYEVETSSAIKQYGLPVEPGKYICLIDVESIRPETTDTMPVEATLNRGSSTEDITYTPRATTSRFTFTPINPANPKVVQITPPDDFDTDKKLKDGKNLETIDYSVRIECHLELLAETSYNFGIRKAVVARPTWPTSSVMWLLHVAAFGTAIFSFF